MTVRDKPFPRGGTAVSQRLLETGRLQQWWGTAVWQQVRPFGEQGWGSCGQVQTTLFSLIRSPLR